MSRNHWKLNEALALYKRRQELLFFKPGEDATDHGSSELASEHYFDRWEDYQCGEFFLRLHRAPEFAESVIDGLFALSQWDQLVLGNGKPLLDAAKAASQYLIARVNERYRSPFESVVVDWIEDEDLNAQHGTGYYAFVNWSVTSADKLEVTITSRPLSNFGRRFGVEMMLHECRHVMQFVFADAPSNRELREGNDFKHREFDSPWERDARLYQHLVSTLFYDGSSGIDDDDSLNELATLRKGWAAYRQITEDSWDNLWREEYVDCARASLRFLSEAASHNPATAEIVQLAESKLNYACWLSHAHAVVGWLTHSKHSGVTNSLLPAYKHYLATCPLGQMICSDPELEAEILVHYSYLANRLSLSHRPRINPDRLDTCVDLFKDAALKALDAYEMTGTRRYLKYVADNLSMIGELRRDLDGISFTNLGDRLFVCGYALPALNRLNVSYVVDRVCSNLPSIRCQWHSQRPDDCGCTMEVYKDGEDSKLAIAMEMINDVESYGEDVDASSSAELNQVKNHVGSGLARDIVIAIAILRRRLALAHQLPSSNLRTTEIHSLRQQSHATFTLVFGRVLAYSVQADAVEPNALNSLSVKEPENATIRRIAWHVRKALEHNFQQPWDAWDSGTLSACGLKTNEELWNWDGN